MPPRSSTSRRSTSAKAQRQPARPKVNRTRPSQELSIADWQRELRRQFGREQKFLYENVGEHPVFSEFSVTNPTSRTSYRVSIRGVEPGRNFCSCPDFATNDLGTCKHVEFVLGQLEDTPKLSSLLSQGFAPPFSEVYIEYGSQRRIRFAAGSECPEKLLRSSRMWFDTAGYLRSDVVNTLDKFLAQAERFEHEIRCYPDTLKWMAQLRDDDHRREALASAFPKGGRSTAFNKLLKVKLFDYQRQGALFAANAGRCLIGDEMGLGKTVQAIAAAEILARYVGIERVLVVCPTSLKHQWEREIERFTERTVQVIGGGLAVRQQLFQNDSFFKITNYDTLHRDLPAICEWSPDLVILDEAQRIKNWSTRAAKTVKQLESPHAIVLTGTPLENRLEELVSLVQFVDQHRLGPTWRLMHNHQQLDENGRVLGYRNLDQIGEALAPILIRRRKADVLDQLPGRTDQTILLPMTGEQLLHHAENADLVARVVSKWKRMGFLSDRDQQALMIGLQRMRMSCNSTYLLDKASDFSTKFDEFLERMDGLLDDPQAKVVVFSQWLGTHELLQRRISQRPWNHVLFHGGVESAKRNDLVTRFREDPDCRFFLATDCGGVGLNLQQAHVIVNMDLPWNPAVLEQRIGRVYRMGQQRPVQVLNFVSQGTIEDGMQSVLKFKKNLFAGVLDGGTKDVFLGGSRLSQFIKTVESVTNGIPTPHPAETESPHQPAAPARASTPEEVAPQVASARVQVDPMADLFRMGLSFLEGLSSQQNSGNGSPGAPKAPPVRVDSDPQTGRPYLRVEWPDPETLDRVLNGVDALIKSLRGQR